jgi:hypothetical protein
MEKFVVFTELVLLALCFVSRQVQAYDSGWNKATATFYGGSDASGTMGKINIYIFHSFPKH